MNIQEFIDRYIVGVLGLVVLGIFALIGFLNPKVRERNKELNDTEDRLIKTLKDEVAVLTTKLDTLQETFHNQTLQVAELTTKYEVLAQVFQGRDEDSVRYRAEGRETMRIVSEGAVKLDAVRAQIEQHNTEAIKFRKQHSEEIQKLYEAIQANTAEVGKIAERLAGK